MQQDGGGGRQIKELLLPLSWGIWSHKCAHKSQTKVAPTESSVCVCRRMTVIGQGKISRKGTNRKGRQSQVIVACKKNGQIFLSSPQMHTNARDVHKKYLSTTYWIRFTKQSHLYIGSWYKIAIQSLMTKWRIFSWGVDSNSESESV